jgi:peptide/nickel transport system permease protein
MSVIRKLLAVLGDALLKLFVFVTIVFAVYNVLVARQTPEVSLPFAFLDFVGNLARFDLGASEAGLEVSFFLLPAIAYSARLFFPPLILAALLALLFARWYYLGNSRVLRSATTWLSQAATTIPVFLLALFLQALASATGLFPISGVNSLGYGELGPAERILDTVHYLVLPSLTLFIFPFILFLNSLEDRVAELRSEDFIRNAYAIGFSRPKVYREHLFPLLVSHLLEQFAVLLPIFITYLVLVESVFGYSGLGVMAVSSFSPIIRAYDNIGFAGTRSALVYLGSFTIIAQFLIRAIRTGLLSRYGGENEGRERSLAATAIVPTALLALVVGPAVGLFEPGDRQTLYAGASAIRLALLAPGALILAYAVARSRGGAKPERLTPPPPPRDAEDASALTPPGKSARLRLRRNLRRHPRSALLAALGMCVAIGVILLGFLIEPPEISALDEIATDRSRLGPWIFTHALRALSLGESLVFPLLGAAAGTVAGLAFAALASIWKWRFLDRLFGVAETFPSVLLLLLLMADRSLPRAFVSEELGDPRATFVLVFAIVGAVRVYRVFADRIADINRREFMLYAQVLGTSSLARLFRHVLPVIGLAVLSSFLYLWVDLIVLQMNLSVVAPFIRNWGGMILGTRGAFIRGMWLPALVPAIFLLIYVALIRLTASGVKKVFAE